MQSSEQERGARSLLERQLLDTVNTIAVDLRLARRSESEVYRLFRERIGRLNLLGLLGFLDRSGENLVVRALAYPVALGDLPAAVAEQARQRLEGVWLPAAPLEHCCQVLTSGRPVFEPNGVLLIHQLLAAQSPAFASHIAAELGNRPALVTPLYVDKDLSGLLILAGEDLGPEELPVTATLANQLGLALLNARLASGPAAPAREADGIRRAVTSKDSKLNRRLISEPLIRDARGELPEANMDQVLDRILLDLERVVPYVSACIFLLQNNRLHAVAARGLPNPSVIVGHDFPADDTLAARTLHQKAPVILNDASQDPDYHGWGNSNHVRGWMAVPLLARDEVIGYLTLDSDQVGAFTAAEANLAQAFASQAATTIENARLFVETQRLLRHANTQQLQLQQVVDLVPDGIVLLDSDRRVILANRAAQSALAQLADAGPGDILVHLARQPLEQLLEQAKSGNSWKELSSSELQRIYEVSARPLANGRDDDDWLLILRNVTDLRRQDVYLRAQERLATVGQLAAGIAHDFNNIMAVISLQTQLVMQVSDLAPGERQRLHTIYQQAQRASNLIGQILDFSRQSVVARRPMDMLPFVEDLVRQIGRRLPETIETELVAGDDQFLVDGDAASLQQMILNLALNARDAMPNGGRLTIGLSHLGLRPFQSFPLPDMTVGEWIELRVVDNGIGIDPELLPHIFEPFFSTEPSSQAAGLGMAQVYGIVKQHDGFIDVESSLGQGTSVVVYLPALKKPEPEVVPDLAKPVFGHGERVLIVEDDRPTREALADIITMLNYTVVTAADGEQALAVLAERQGEIDLVISDMVMPVMGGAMLFARMQELQPGIKMILITGYPLGSSGKELLNQGIAAYVQKPLRLDDIANAIHEALTRQ